MLSLLACSYLRKVDSPEFDTILIAFGSHQIVPAAVATLQKPNSASESS